MSALYKKLDQWLEFWGGNAHFIIKCEIILFISLVYFKIT